MKRRSFNLAVLALAASALASATHPALAQQSKAGTIYKSPECGCCDGYASYLHHAGYAIMVISTPNLAAVKDRHEIPSALQSCHTMIIGGYVVEGHVPAKHIERLLGEKPRIRGIALPGMPAGAPGMDGLKTVPLTIYEIGKDAKTVYAVD